MGSVVVLNTCLCVVFLSNVSKGGVGEKKGGKEGGGKEGQGEGGKEGGQGGVAFYGKRSYITRQKESRLTAKGVPIDGKRSPIATHKRSPLSLKEESRWPPWDSVLKRSPMALYPSADTYLSTCTTRSANTDY